MIDESSRGLPSLAHRSNGATMRVLAKASLRDLRNSKKPAIRAWSLDSGPTGWANHPGRLTAQSTD